MIKNKLILTAVAAMVYITTTSYHGGAAAEGGLNRTGADGSVAGCAGSGCHTGTAPAATAMIYVDSAGGVPVTKYTPGKTYTIRLVGKHSVNTEFGLQFAAVSGSGTAQVQAGTFASTLPLAIANVSLAGLQIIEHSNHVEAESPADSFVRSITWTAPSSSVGNITLYLAVNAVDHDHMANSGDVSATVSKVLQPYPAATGIQEALPAHHITAVPNPATQTISITVSNLWGRYTLYVQDMLGRQMLSKTVNTAGTAENLQLNIVAWPAGTYFIALQNDTERWTNEFVKN